MSIMKLVISILVIVLFSFQTSVSQTIILDETGKYISQETIEFENMSKDLLFEKSMEWLALNYSSSQDVIQYSNLESGKIICKGSFETSLFMKSGFILHALTLEFKEGKVRQTYTSFSYYSSGSGEIAFESKSMGMKKKVLKETTGKIVSATKSFKEYLHGKNEDW